MLSSLILFLLFCYRCINKCTRQFDHSSYVGVCPLVCSSFLFQGLGVMCCVQICIPSLYPYSSLLSLLLTFTSPRPPLSFWRSVQSSQDPSSLFCSAYDCITSAPLQATWDNTHSNSFIYLWHIAPTSTNSTKVNTKVTDYTSVIPAVFSSHRCTSWLLSSWVNNTALFVEAAGGHFHYYRR